MTAVFLEAGKCETVSRSKSFFAIYCINGRWPFSSSKALQSTTTRPKKLGTQDDAFGKIVALPPSSLLCFVTLCLFTRSKMSTLYSSQATQKAVGFGGESQKDKENTDAVDWPANSLRQAFLKGGYGTQVWVTHFA